MLRWLGVLLVLSMLTGSLALGIIPTHAVGLAKMLFSVFAGLLTISLVIGIIQPG